MSTATTQTGIASGGDTRCPTWCVECSPGICHRSYSTEVDLGEVTVHLSVRQWRNGYPDDELLPGWQPARVTYFICHNTETVDVGCGPDGPIIVSASDPVALTICFGVDPVTMRELLAAQQQLLALLERDGSVGDV